MQKCQLSPGQEIYKSTYMPYFTGSTERESLLTFKVLYFLFLNSSIVERSLASARTHFWINYSQPILIIYLIKTFLKILCFPLGTCTMSLGNVPNAQSKVCKMHAWMTFSMKNTRALTFKHLWNKLKQKLNSWPHTYSSGWITQNFFLVQFHLKSSVPIILSKLFNNKSCNALFCFCPGWQHTQGDWHQPPCERRLWESWPLSVPATQGAWTGILWKGTSWKSVWSGDIKILHFAQSFK